MSAPKLQKVVSNLPEPTGPADRVIMDVSDRLNRDEYDGLGSGYARVGDTVVKSEEYLGVFIHDSSRARQGDWSAYNYTASKPVASYFEDAHDGANRRLAEKNAAAFEAEHFARLQPKAAEPPKRGWLARLLARISGGASP